MIGENGHKIEKYLKTLNSKYWNILIDGLIARLNYHQAYDQCASLPSFIRHGLPYLQHFKAEYKRGLLVEKIEYQCESRRDILRRYVEIAVRRKIRK